MSTHFSFYWPFFISSCDGYEFAWLKKNMLGWLSPEGRMEKYSAPPPPLHLVHAFFSCRLHWRFKYSLQENYLGWIMSIMLPMFALYTLIGLKYIGKLFTVKNSPWDKRAISLDPCFEKMTTRLGRLLFSKQTLKVDETWLPISCSYVFLI